MIYFQMKKIKLTTHASTKIFAMAKREKNEGNYVECIKSLYNIKGHSYNKNKSLSVNVRKNCSQL